MKKKSGKSHAAAWRESIVLGYGLLFLSLLAFTSPSLFGGGFLLFFMGLYFFLHGIQMRKRKRSSLTQWVGLKALQSVILIAVGIVLMVALPQRFLGVSLLLILYGFLMFLYIRRKYTKK